MLELAKIFSQGMILQREKTVAVWGRADSGAEVSVRVQGVSAKAAADENGAWTVKLPPLRASLRETLTAESGEERIVVEDVAVGEVWIAGGQSNMEFPLRFEKHRDRELTHVDRKLRFYDVPKKYYPEQDKDFDYSKVAVWRMAEGDSLPYFSAVGYYFQKELAEKLDVPVGIVGCNWGGTRSCAWMKEETARSAGPAWVEEWERATRNMDMEKYWEDRRTDPRSSAGNPGTDPFSMFIMPGTPSEEEIAAFYRGMLEEMGISVDENEENPAEKLESLRASVDAKTKPGILFENMVAETAPYTVRGCIWYQGESDDVPGRQSLYADMLEGLIRDWREAFQDESLPFLQVQLPGWSDWLREENLDYVTIRRCQEEVTDRTEGVHMASISDVGEEKDIHPKDKRTVGHRLALLARHYVYGEELLCEAPRPERTRREGRRITISFRHAGGGLKCTEDYIEALRVSIGGAETAFTAEVQGDELRILLGADVTETVRVDFAKEAWYQVNLFNEADIPAIPFSVEC